MEQGENQVIAVQVAPKAGRDEIVGEVTDAAGKQWLKIKVAAAPEDGKANKAVIALLAKHLGVAPSRLTIIRGETSRKKMVHVAG